MQEYKDILDYIESHCGDLDNYDIVMAVYSEGDKEKDSWIKGYVDVGMNWVLECLDPWRGGVNVLFDMVERGPPKL